MISDLITIFATIALLTACVYGLKTRVQLLSAIVLGITIPPILITLVVNIPVVTSPLTPIVHGKIIDAKTKKALAGINVRAGWFAGSVSVGGGGGEYYKFYKTKTDSNGKFELPRGFKSLTMLTPPGYPLIESKFIGINLIVYPSNYDYMVQTEQIKSEKEVVVSMDRVEKDTDFIENIRLYWRWLSSIHKGNGDNISDPKEREWLEHAHYQFEKLYPTSKVDESFLEELAHHLDSMNSSESVVLLKKLLDKYPSSVNAWSAKNFLVFCKQKYNIR